MKIMISMTQILGIVLCFAATNFSARSYAATCGNFSGTYKGTMSNSNYWVNATVTQPADCSSISIHFYGVDRDYTLRYKMGPATASVVPGTGVIHAMASLSDYTNLYLMSFNTDGYSAPASLTVLSLPTANTLTISFLGGLLITFEGTRVTK